MEVSEEAGVALDFARSETPSSSFLLSHAHPYARDGNLPGDGTMLWSETVSSSLVLSHA